MASEWDEVKRLAADFQKAQLTSTTQRLSERNCIEIVKKLIERSLIDVIYTTDGKEYITSQHLSKEIEDEIYVHQGRINLVDLTQIINVDYSHIENKSKELASQQSGLAIILGQIISIDYLDRLAEEVNEKLQQVGQISIGDITKQYDLPGDYLEQVIHRRLGTIVQGIPDPNDNRIIFTDAYVAQNKARIRGVLSAITRPVHLSQIISHYNFPDKLFHNLITELIKEKWLSGVIVGGKGDQATYIPNIYAKAQNEWVENFYSQNGYLEYDSMSRLGISDPANFVSRKYQNEKLLFLKSCCIGPSIVSQVEASLDEAISASTWVDILPLLPSILSTSDTAQIIQTMFKSRAKSTIHIFCDSILVTDDFLNKCMDTFDLVLNIKAEEAVKKGEILQYFVDLKAATSKQAGKSDRGKESIEATTDKRDDRRKKATGGKAGGGTQGRETKMKAVKNKKKGRGGDDALDEESNKYQSSNKSIPELTFMTLEEIEEQLGKIIALKDCPEEMLTALAETLFRPLKKKYQAIAETLYHSSISGLGANKKKKFSEFQDKAITLYSNIYLCEKGLKILSDDLCSQLQKYLVKSLCTELANHLVAYLAEDQGLHKAETPMTNEIRNKIIPRFVAEYKDPLLKLNNSLNAKTPEDFLANIEDCLDICDIITKKMDKKKEKQALQELRAKLNSQLEETSEPALVLHLAIILIFLAQTQHMIHASGKFVPAILTFLHNKIPTDAVQLLHEGQDLVLKKLTAENKDDSESDVDSKLQELIPKIKHLVKTFKKQAPSNEAE